ncbi:MAG: hypothetical protein ACLS6R_15100 [Eggerthella lenta]
MTGNAPGANAQDTYEFTNTNKWDTRQLVTMALMCAIGVLLSFVEFPLLPGVTWLKYDAPPCPPWCAASPSARRPASRWASWAPSSTASSWPTSRAPS